MVVDKLVGLMSDSLMLNAAIIDGSTNVMLAWSSRMAKPLMVVPVFGHVNWMGHVLLYEDARKIVPWAYF